jgi:hypothetical protein
MPTTQTAPLNDDGDQYTAFLTALHSEFSVATQGVNTLFTTTAPDLWEIFLNELPSERRKHYTCRSCEHFVKRFGGLVTISEDGHTRPVLWNATIVPPFFVRSVQAVHKAVLEARVDGVFVSKDDVWGLPSNTSSKPPGIWHHMAVTPRRSLIYRSVSFTAGQRSAELLQDKEMLVRAMGAFPLSATQAAVTILSTGNALYRSEKVLGVAQWFASLQEKYKDAKRGLGNNLLWTAVASAPAGFCHVRSSMIGTLLEDIVAGLPYEEIKARFEAKMNPQNYQRAQVAPSAGNIAEAEKVISTMKAAGSLERRYARLEELQRFVWRPVAPKSSVGAPGGVFGHLSPKTKEPTGVPLVLPQQVMTWEKFQRTVLPDAQSIEVRVPASPDRFMALVTAAQPEAPPILQWDREEARNPFSWYYASGIDAEIKRRVLGAGGRYDDVDIRASLIWNNRNDLDLHVVTAKREEIFYAHKRSVCGGWLDVDMNVHGETTSPIENVRWAKGTAPEGRYSVYVQNYRFHEQTWGPTPFRVELEVQGEMFHYDGQVSPRGEMGIHSNVAVAEFIYTRGQKLNKVPTGVRQANTGSSWNLVSGQWAKVTGIVDSPNLWAEPAAAMHGQHTFFLLEGCKDTAQSVGRGFFVETLRNEFRPIRSTLEAYAASAPIAGAEDATACGIGMTNTGPWDLVVRVTAKNGATLQYKIDRRD